MIQKKQKQKECEQQLSQSLIRTVLRQQINNSQHSYVIQLNGEHRQFL